MRTRPLLVLLLLGLVGLAPHARADDPDRDPPGRVGRINLVDGRASLSPAGTETWLDDVLNRPLADGDRIWVDEGSRAELHVGSAALRLDGGTAVQVETIDDRTVRLRVTAGRVHAHVRSLDNDQSFEFDTPNAMVAALREGTFLIDVADGTDALDVGVMRGQVAVTGPRQSFSLRAGDHGRYTGQDELSEYVTRERPDDDFVRWAESRDRAEERAYAARYVPRDMVGYEDLDRYGRWTSYPEYGDVWVPATVAVGWAPYRYGHWAWISPWGWTWIDDAPWGFAPFHYGRWVYVGGGWAWAPGRRVIGVRPVYAPALVGWCGGGGWSVGLSIGGPPVGWFPLGWNEVYVPRYRASPVYIRQVNVTNVTNVTIINRYTDPRYAGQVNYANQRVPGAVTATSQDTFKHAQPVNRNFVAVPAALARQATASSLAPTIAPTPRSVAPAAAQGGPVPPPAKFARPVLGRAPGAEPDRGREDGRGGAAPPVVRLPPAATSRQNPAPAAAGAPAAASPGRVSTPPPGGPRPDGERGRVTYGDRPGYAGPGARDSATTRSIPPAEPDARAPARAERPPRTDVDRGGPSSRYEVPRNDRPPGRDAPSRAEPAPRFDRPPRTEPPARAEAPARVDRPMPRDEAPPRNDRPPPRDEAPPRSERPVPRDEAPARNARPLPRDEAPPRVDRPVPRVEAPPRVDRPVPRVEAPPRYEPPPRVERPAPPARTEAPRAEPPHPAARPEPRGPEARPEPRGAREAHEHAGGMRAA
jgi:hypothetical protein